MPPLTTIYDGGTRVIGDAGVAIVQQPLHPSTMNFISAQSGAGYTMSLTEINAVNNLVVGMVATGLWSKMQVIYPCIGNATVGANAFKWNLKDTSAFNITFLGSWTFASTGMQIASASRSNYGRTGYTPSTSQTVGSAHASIYIRNFYLSSTFSEGVFGSYGQFNSNGTVISVSQYVANSTTMTCQNATPNTSGIISLTGYAGGLLTVNRNTSASFSVAALNGMEKRANLNATTNNATTLEMWIGMINLSGGVLIPQPQEIGFASIGTGLTELDIKNLYALVQAFQTSLNRQV